MQPTAIRRLLLVFILVFICLSPYFMLIDSIYISFSFSLLLFCTFILLGLSSVKYNTIVMSFICMIGYVGLLLWEKLTPILFFISSKVLIAILVVCIVRFLLRTLTHRVVVIVIGLTWGQLMYEMILVFYELHNTLGNYEYVNYLFLTVFGLFISEVCIFLIKKITYIVRLQT